MAHSTTSLDIYQLKISLDIKPTVWRRVQMSKESTFKELHHVIVCTLGWTDYHCHKFETPSPKSRFDSRTLEISTSAYGDNPHNEQWSETLKRTDGSEVTYYYGTRKLDEAQTKLCDYFKAPKDLIEYVYDFGKEWPHKIVLEKILPSVVGKVYPVCVTGKRGCPPEEDPTGESDEEYDDNDWEDAVFDPKSVKFSSNCYRICKE